ncbi:MAG: M23 family peptidase [Balneolaceae bacterium]|nr:MAG: M23 family peptidase [Balneolaceae bacterium]
MSKANNHYYYDEEQCQFVPLEYNTRKKLLNALSFWLINGLVLAIAGLAVLSNIAGTPAEIALKDENRVLIEQLQRTESAISKLEKNLTSIAEMDNQMYRVILGMEPLSDDIRAAGTGGSDPYSHFDFYSLDASEILRNTAARIDQLERRIGIQKISFEEIKNYYNLNQERLINMPAIRPVNGPITSGFGMRRHPILRYMAMHEGVDFRAEIGTEVFATGNGTILFAGRNGAYGISLEIDHGFGIVTRYAHLSAFASGISVGDTVERGQMIAYSGNSGRSSGPHLHYEVLVNGRAQDPIHFMIADITPEEYLIFKRENTISSETEITQLLISAD